MEVSTAERTASGGPAPELQAANLVAAFDATVERLGDQVAIRTKGDDFTISWSDMRSRVHAIAGGLAKLGVSKGDTVALMTMNRPEFNLCDLAAVTIGGVPFSIYQTYSPEQIRYVVSDAGSKVAIVESMFLESFQKAREDLPGLEHLIVIDSDGGDHTLAEVEGMDPDFEPDVSAIDTDDHLTLIYTSGTTGPPKGVQLTHRNLMTLTSSLEDIIPFPEEGGKVISWLPTAHIAERGANYYLPLAYGIQITVCPDPKQIIDYLPEVRPTWFFAVPRIWEKLKSGLESKLAQAPDEQAGQARQALEAATKKVQLEQAGQDVPDELAAGVKKADAELFSGLRKALGFDEAVAVNTGAAPTPREVLEFFHAIGIPLGELWGMSETCGAATCNPVKKIKIGTVGPPLPGAEIRLASDGEVLVRGDMVMPGYRNMPDKTEEAIDDDGWLLTGDIGELDSDGYLKIIDRKKELIINAAGKNMSPAEIESKIKSASPLVGQAVAIGDGRRYNVALIVLDPDYAPVWAEKQGLDVRDVDEIAKTDEAREAVQKAIDEAGEKLARVEQIKKFALLPEEWEPGGDELTPTMKLKRKPIDERYSEQIEELYAD